MRSAKRESENQRRRERYASDPAYREKRLEQGRASGLRRARRQRAAGWWSSDEAKARYGDTWRRGRAARRARLRAAFDEHVSPLVVLERDDGVCGICGGDVDPQNFHIDHVVPLVAGGRHAYDNVQTAHPACNLAKGAIHHGDRR